MIVLDGQPALSAFRIDRLNAELERVAVGCRLRSAWHVYVIAEVEGAAIDTGKLHRILLANGDEATSAALWVAPRVGTISPWSSKATDILRRCGLGIRRVERAVAFDLEPAPDRIRADGTKPLRSCMTR